MHTRGVMRAGWVTVVAFLVGRVAAAQCSAHWSPNVSVNGVIAGPAALTRLFLLTNGDVAVLGSFTTVGGAPSNGVAIYHPGSNTWTATGPAAPPTVDIFGVGPGGTLVGAAGTGVARYDPVSHALTDLGPVPPRGCAGLSSIAATPDGAVFAAYSGSFDDDLYTCDLAAIMRRDPVSGTWGVFSMLDTALVGVSAIASGDLVARTSAYDHPCASCDIYTSSVSVYAPATNEGLGGYSSGTLTGGGYVAGVAVLPNHDLVFWGDLFPIGSGLPASARYVARLSQWTWSALGAGVPSAVRGLVALANGDVVALTADGLYRYRDGAAAWVLQPGSLGPFGSVDAISDWIVLPGGRFLVAGSSGVQPNQTPVLARYDLACATDFNCSGGLESQDIFDFLNAWFALDPRADFNGAGGVSVQDIFDYLSAWLAGC